MADSVQSLTPHQFQSCFVKYRGIGGEAPSAVSVVIQDY